MQRAKSVIGALAMGLAVGWAVAWPAAADAHGPRTMHRHRPMPVAAPLVSVTLQSTDGIALPTAMSGNQTFVAGEQGDRYEIAIQNNTADRVEVVVSVDGRDAVSGRLGDFTTQRGYVVQPFGRVVIDGFRTSMDSVAAFRFSSVRGSFAGRSGTPQHAGVIGVAVFREQGRRIARGGMTKRAAPRADFDATGSAEARPGTSAPSAGARDRSAAARRWTPPEPTRELGTAFGEHRFSSARQVTFVRANSRRPDFTTQLQYDTARGLAARGVPIEVQPVFTRPPSGGTAWPGATDPRFTQPPPR